MAASCPDCSRPFRRDRPAVTSVTGRRICADCNGGILAAAAGVMANPGAPVPGATATAGWFQRLRSRRRNP